MKTAVIILGHGSRNDGSDKAIKRIAAEVKRAGKFGIVEYAFLQYVQPSPQEAVERCVGKGATKIVVVPFFMQPGAHVTRHVPAFIEEARKHNPTLDIRMTDFVGNHPLMTHIVIDQVKKAK